MPKGPANIEELMAIKDPAKQAIAARDYIQVRENAIQHARNIRDVAINELLKTHGVAEVARMCDVSVSTVKLVRFPKR